jgi:MFS superfamily sulfate permease-like transporter
MIASNQSHASEKPPVVRGDAKSFVKYFRYDFSSGFLVFLIALPLCLGISLASGFPPMAGIFTAIIGAILAPFISNSEMTIKGPAAGLIVIVIGCVHTFGGADVFDGSVAANVNAYRATLAVIFAAAVVQILFGIFRGGILGDFFPTAAVHGMLAAIGVIIILKQFPVAIGQPVKGEPIEIIEKIPSAIMNANPAIAMIGGVSLLIMFCWPLVGKRVPVLKPIPSQLMVLAIAVPLGMFLDLLHKHSYTVGGASYELGEQFLVRMPSRVFGMVDEITYPDFTALLRYDAWIWVFMFFAIGSLESMLSAKAVDNLDPLRRRTSMDRDVLAVGVGNLIASSIGGLPMISEIVRSRANIDNGAKTRFANFWHGMMLLACVALIPTILHRIPLASLAAMLVYTGYRLAHPREFIHILRIGREQLIIFVTTLVAVLLTDLLVGVGIGIAVKFLIHSLNGVPLKSFFKPFLEVEQVDDENCIIRAHQSAVFSNWIPFRRQIEDLGLIQRQNIVIDLSDTKLVDSSTMEKLHEMQNIFADEGLKLNVVGLEGHAARTEHELSTRVGGMTRLRRITILTDQANESDVIQICNQQSIRALFSDSINPSSGRASMVGPTGSAASLVAATLRVEVVAAPNVCDEIIVQLRTKLPANAPLSIIAETVHMLSRSGITVA